MTTPPLSDQSGTDRFSMAATVEEEMKAIWAVVKRMQAERDRYREALERIADERQGDVEHIDHAKRLARRALDERQASSDG